MVRVIYSGLDVHKDTINTAFVDSSGEVLFENKINHHWPSVKKIFTRIRSQYKGAPIQVCYEAGPTGYGLARELSEMNGIECRIAAPGKLPRRTDRIKTDRRDAMSLATTLLTGTLTSVRIPDPEDESSGELLRYRKSRKQDLTRIKQEIKAFLLRHGHTFKGVGSWSRSYLEWIEKLALGDPMLGEIRDRYLQEYCHLVETLKALDGQIKQMAQGPRYAQPVKKLTRLRGIGTLTAMSFCVEVGDFSRFPDAKSFMSYVGLVPSEYSSGGRIARGGITKQGNRELRRLLIEASWQYFKVHKKRKVVYEKGGRSEVDRYADKALDRLSKKKHLLSDIRGKDRKVVCVAIARELAGFIWGMMNSKY